MFGKMMNSYLYGKSGQGDYNKENLPRTRMQLFWEMLRVRLAGLMRLNLIYLVAWLPALFFIARGLTLWFTGMVDVGNMQFEVEQGTVTAEAYAQASALWGDTAKAILMQTLLFLFPSIAITGPSTAGLCYVTRNWARDEHAFLWSDFKDAVKANWKPALLTSAITGVTPLVGYVCVSFYGQMAAQNPLFYVPEMITVVICLLWLAMQMYTYPQIVTYSLSYKDMLKNSMLMAVGRLPMTLGLKLLSLVPSLIFAGVSLLTPYFQYALMAYGAYYAFIGFALSRFVNASYTNAVFDKYINAKLEGVEINRGLYNEADDEDDEAPADALPDGEAAPENAPNHNREL